MVTGLLPNLETQVAVEAVPATESLKQPAYLARIATLPASLPDRPEAADSRDVAGRSRPDSARLDQIEHALTILASVVAQLAKEAQQSRTQLRATELDPGLHEERRVQRELVRSLQARLIHVEERIARQMAETPQLPTVRQPHAEAAAETSEQIASSLSSIRNSLAALAKRRSAKRIA